MTTHGRELLSLEEIRDVSRAFGLPRPIEAEPIGRGSRLSAKSSLRAKGRRYMLKRRAPDQSGLERVEFLHAFQKHLSSSGVPVPRLVTSLDGRTALPSPAGTYELFEWVEGGRWKQQVSEAAEVGAALGSMLTASESFTPPSTAAESSFHSAVALAGASATVMEAVARVEPRVNRANLQRVLELLILRSARAALKVDAIGLCSSPRLCIHGDTHPGNVLFESGRIQALLDFDAARLDHRACEIANALVHFGNSSIVNVPDQEWRAELDLRRVQALLAGLNNGLPVPIGFEERSMLPWLMIESCTLESIVPIARSGQFAHLGAERFLAFIEEKTAWIESNALQISAC